MLTMFNNSFKGFEELGMQIKVAKILSRIKNIKISSSNCSTPALTN